MKSNTIRGPSRNGLPPFPNFNGTLQAKAVFPGKNTTAELEERLIELYAGDVIVTREVRVSNGKFPPISIPIPKGISAGNAHVEYYAESAAHIAVGGDSFTVLIPKILDIQPELASDTTFRISIQASDELESQGIKEVILEWLNPRIQDWKKVMMVPAPSRGKGWYTVPEPLPLPLNGETIKYEIICQRYR